MNETIVAKGLAKHLAETWGTSFADGIIVHNKAQTANHGYTSGCATILWEEGEGKTVGATKPPAPKDRGVGCYSCTFFGNIGGLKAVMSHTTQWACLPPPK